MKVLDLPPIVLGCSPFIGAGQFGIKSLTYYRRFYLQPENMVKLFQLSFELGVKAVQLLSDKPIDALIEACKNTGVEPFTIYSTHSSGSRLTKILDKLSSLKPEVIAVHAEISDSHDVERIMERWKVIKEYGSVLGLATHIPGETIPWVEEADVPVEVILAPLNRIGYAMEPSFEESLEAIQRCSRQIVAIKPLAAGRLTPIEAFEFVYKYVDSLTVGIASEKEMRETYEAANIAYRGNRKFRGECN